MKVLVVEDDPRISDVLEYGELGGKVRIENSGARDAAANPGHAGVRPSTVTCSAGSAGLTSPHV